MEVRTTILLSDISNEENTDSFMDYLHNTYFGENARFNPSIWCHWDEVMDGNMLSTNNISEGLNSALNSVGSPIGINNLVYEIKDYVLSNILIMNSHIMLKKHGI